MPSLNALYHLRRGFPRIRTGFEALEKPPPSGVRPLGGKRKAPCPYPNLPHLVRPTSHTPDSGVMACGLWGMGLGLGGAGGGCALSVVAAYLNRVSVRRTSVKSLLVVLCLKRRTRHEYRIANN